MRDMSLQNIQAPTLLEGTEKARAISIMENQRESINLLKQDIAKTL